MESQFVTWKQAVLNSMGGFLDQVISILPNLIGAIIVLLVGLFLSSLLGRLARRLIDLTKLDTVLGKMVGIEKLKKNGKELSASGFVGWAVKWFFIIVTFIAMADILKWDQLTRFFESVALYIPNVIITVLILLAGFILGGGLKEVIVKAVKASTLPDTAAGLIGTVARWAVIIFAVMAGLTQLGIAADLVRILFTGFVAMLALAGGLSFGLGGRDKAGAWLDKIQKEMKH